MKRDIIIIEDKTVSVTGNEVWMTAGEIAEEFHATVPAVNAAIKAVRKSDVLNDYEVCRYIQLEVIRLQQFTQSRFGIKHLTCQKDKGQHPVVAILLQGAAAYPEHFRHLPVRQVMFPVQWRTVTFQKCGEPFGAFEHILYRGGNRLVLH